MQNCLKLCVLIMSICLMFGCAARKGSQGDTHNTVFHRSYQTAFFDKDQAKESRNILQKARSAVGVSYVRGGTSPAGFDCSGFVCWVYRSMGIDLPRSAHEQSHVGKLIARVEDMREGDIVAFRHPRRGYHTGIYVGDGKFIHSPRPRSTVSITTLSDPYFNNTLLGARRIDFNGNKNFVAEAQVHLNDCTEQKAVRNLTSPKTIKGKRGDIRRNNRNSKSNKNSLTAARQAKDNKSNIQRNTAEKTVKQDAGSNKNSREKLFALNSKKSYSRTGDSSVLAKKKQKP